MKNVAKIFFAVGLLSISQLAISGSITDTYNTGDTLTAQTLDNIKTAVNDNDSRVTVLEGFSRLVDSSSVVIGSIIGMNTDTWTIVNTSGFILQVRADGFPGSNRVIYFDGLNCTGTPYITLGSSGNSTTSAQNAVWITQGYVVADLVAVGIYYAPKNSFINKTLLKEQSHEQHI